MKPSNPNITNVPEVTNTPPTDPAVKPEGKPGDPLPNEWGNKPEIRVVPPYNE